MVKADRSTWKSNYFLRIDHLFEKYSRFFIVHADNVGSKQMQETRMTFEVRLKFSWAKTP